MRRFADFPTILKQALQAFFIGIRLAASDNYYLPFSLPAPVHFFCIALFLVTIAVRNAPAFLTHCTKCEAPYKLRGSDSQQQRNGPLTRAIAVIHLQIFPSPESISPHPQYPDPPGGDPSPLSAPQTPFDRAQIHPGHHPSGSPLPFRIADLPLRFITFFISGLECTRFFVFRSVGVFWTFTVKKSHDLIGHSPLCKSCIQVCIKCSSSRTAASMPDPGAAFPVRTCRQI